MNSESQQEAAQHVCCPHCEAVQEVEPVTVIRPTDDSLVQLFKGTLNRVTCSSCETPFLLDVPLLFRDDDEKLLIYFIPMQDIQKWREAEEQMKELTKTIFDDEIEAFEPQCRLTLTRKTFVEKISLHLHRLNDRLIEYIKYQLYENPQKKIDPIRNELLYDFSAQDDGKLPFLVMDRESGQATAGAHIPIEIYSELASTFLTDSKLQEELASLFPGFYVSVEKLL